MAKDEKSVPNKCGCSTALKVLAGIGTISMVLWGLAIIQAMREMRENG